MAEGQSLKTLDIRVYKIYDFEISIWRTGPPTPTAYATVCHYCGGHFPTSILKAVKVITCWAAVIGISSNKKIRKIYVRSIWHVLLKGGIIRCNEICFAGSVIFYSHVQKKKEWATDHKNNNTPVPGDTAECCSAREIQFHVTLHPLQHAALTPKSSHWISHSKLPQPLYLVWFNVISYRLLGSDAVSTKLHSITSQKTTHLIRLSELQPSIMDSMFQHFSLQVVCPVHTHKTEFYQLSPQNPKTQ